MKTILTIGYNRFLLPDNSMITNCLQQLNCPLDATYQTEKKGMVFTPSQDALDIRVEFVPDDSVQLSPIAASKAASE